MNVIKPDGMSPRTWCDFMSMLLQRSVAPMKIESEEEWRLWGAHARKILQRRGVVVPDPSAFPDFVSWASRFNLIVQTL